MRTNTHTSRRASIVTTLFVLLSQLIMPFTLWSLAVPVRAADASVTAAPIVPEIGSALQTRLQAIAARGQTSGLRSDVFAKVGDGLINSQGFLSNFGCNDQELGSYSSLAPTIANFKQRTFPAGFGSNWCSVSNSFTRPSQGTLDSGGVAQLLQASGLRNPSACSAPNDNPLACEAAALQPGIILLIVGTFDIERGTDTATFKQRLTEVAQAATDRGSIPILFTLPPRTDSAGAHTAQLDAYNAAILQIGQEQNLPVANLWRALQTVPQFGLETDGIHLSTYQGGDHANLSDAALAYGYNRLNLVALQALEQIKRNVFDGQSTPAPTPSPTPVITPTPSPTVTPTSPPIVEIIPTSTVPNETTGQVSSSEIIPTPPITSTVTYTGNNVSPTIDASMKANLREIYLRGLRLGNRAGVFAKVGDSITESGSFLSDIGCGVEELGNNSDLAPTIQYFRNTSFPSNYTAAWCGTANSFTRGSAAAGSGWSADYELRPGVSQSSCAAPYNTPLTCEIHLLRPSIALIMLGTNDLQRTNDLVAYRGQLETIIRQLEAEGVIPLLSTIPPRLDNATYGARVAAYNQTIADVARANHVPLMDYWQALQDPALINQGISSDGVHPSVLRGNAASNLTAEGLRYGYNLRNLVALQSLQKIKRIIIDDGAADGSSATNVPSPSPVITPTAPTPTPTVISTNTTLTSAPTTGGTPSTAAPRPTDFTVSLNVAQLNAPRNGQVRATVRLQRVNFPARIQLSLTGLPRGARAVFQPTITVRDTATLTISTSNVTPGNYPLLLRAQSGRTIRTTNFRLIVSAPTPPISVTPSLPAYQPTNPPASSTPVSTPTPIVAPTTTTPPPVSTTVQTGRYAIGTPSVREIWIDPTRGADNNNGDTTHPLRTLRAAWNLIPQHTTLTTGFRIMLRAGTYDAANVPSNNWYDGRYGTYQTPIILQAADGPGTAILPNLNIHDVKYFYLIGLTVRANGGDVLHFEQADHALVRNVRIEGLNRGPQEGLKVNQSQYVYVEDSDISGAWDNALDFMAVQYGQIVGNRIHDANDWCAYTKGGSAYIRVEGNEFYNCGTGGFTAGQGAGIEYTVVPWINYQAYDIKVLNNVVHDTDGAGLGVNGGYNILLANNTLYRVGRRSHALEIVFGNYQCDGLTAQCQQRISQGAWATATRDEMPISNRNVFIYNNLVYNPSGFQSQWKHFAIYAPRSTPGGSSAPNPAQADINLQIKGNIIWNGSSNLALGAGDSGEGCTTSNPTCNATQLRADNSINVFEPQLVNPNGGDFHPVSGGNITSARVFTPPSFTWDNLPLTGIPVGTLTNNVPLTRDGTARVQTRPGAY